MRWKRCAVIPHSDKLQFSPAAKEIPHFQYKIVAASFCLFPPLQYTQIQAGDWIDHAELLEPYCDICPFFSAFDLRHGVPCAGGCWCFGISQQGPLVGPRVNREYWKTHPDKSAASLSRLLMKPRHVNNVRYGHTWRDEPDLANSSDYSETAIHKLDKQARRIKFQVITLHPYLEDNRSRIELL